MAERRPSVWIRIIIPLVLVATWLGVSAVGGPYFGRIEEVSEVDLTAFLPKSAEATQVSKKLGEFVSNDTLAAVVVYEAESGDKLSSAQSAEIEKVRETIASANGVEGELSPTLVSDDGKAAFIVAQASTEVGLKEVVGEIRATISEDTIEGAKGFVTGPAGFAADLNVAFAGIDGILLLTALSVVLVILIVVYRSVLLPIIVLMTSIFALSAGILLVFTLAKAGLVELNGQVQGILFILVIGAATDYSLLYVSRYREALYSNALRWNATKEAFKGALEPILASGGTVIVGLLCLLLSDLASNKALGPVGAIGIAMAMLSALTFLPAVLLLTGRKAFWPVVPRATPEARRIHETKSQRSVWHKVGEIVRLHPRPIWIVTVIALGCAALFAPQLKADGVPQDQLIVGYSEAREGQKVLGRHFPDGSGSPAQVIVKETEMSAAVAAADKVKGVESVSVVATGTDSKMLPVGEYALEIQTAIRQQIEARASGSPVPIETLVAQANPFKDAKPVVRNGEVLLQLTLTADPNSNEAKDIIRQVRQDVQSKSPSAIVGGVTAAQLDTTTASIRDRAIIIPVVLVAITIILAILLRAIVAPILLLMTTVLSFASSIGVSALLFNHIWGFPGADPSVLLYGFVFLVALGIDYNIFLMTRVREESLKVGTSAGVIKGLVVTGGVITSAGVVLAATFAALAVIPILFLLQLAFIVAFGVLLDTLIVRSLLVPALIKDIGPSVWWPSGLKK
ncbi:MAG: putative drug exporter of the superfamily [Patescibacteria group bacterium]|nr:putative drug exporter of the superfamily [Patescibacteria group bacterium]